MENVIGNKINFRIATLVSLAVMLVIMLWTSKDFGISGDEMTQNTYGQKVYDYYASFGKDKSCLEPFGRISNAFYYGGFYDMVCVTVNKFSPLDPFDTRHMLDALCGFFIIFFAARLARMFKGWDAALLVCWFLFLSPRFFGESMNNPKDVPFALGMLMGVCYICRFVRAFPKPTRMDMIGLTLSVAFAISIRVGGILLIPFLMVAVGLQYFFDWKKQYTLGSKEVRQLVIRSVIICTSGYLLGLVFWPYALQDPMSNPFTALGEMSQFSTSISMLFNDNKIMSENVPWYYIPQWLFISTPVIILLGVILSPYLFISKEYKFPQLSFLFFAALFPLFYVIYKKSPLYDGWRHLFFIYPPLMTLSALTFISLINKLKNKYGQYAITGLLVLGLALPAKWCIADHPNEIVYFNELVGGINGAYGHYETDYYMNSLKQASYKLAKMEDLFHTKDTVVVGTNAIEPVIHYFQVINPKIVCVYLRYYQRYEKKWDYAIFYTRFLDKELLLNNYFPPANTIGVIKADNAPLCAIIKKDPEFLAYKANGFMKANNFDSAVVYYEEHFKKEPNDESSYDSYAIALANKGRINDAIIAIKKKLTFTPNDLQSYDLLTKLYRAIGDKVNEQQAASKIREIQEKEQGAE
jgi:tetratricopeptide (TPR) repeat protein